MRAIVDLARIQKDRPRLERWLLEAARLDPDIMENPGVRELLGR